jgi:peptidoglycan hydrolase-like protein with peptidoglycan-binding domain
VARGIDKACIMERLYELRAPTHLNVCAVPSPAHLTQQENKMKIVLTAMLAALLSLSAFAVPQNVNTSTAGNANAAKKRAAPFHANKDQITQAQTILKQRGFYTGDATGKLDQPTRDGLKKYQQAEGLKVTGTLNAATLQKMSVALTEKQRTWVASQGSK